MVVVTARTWSATTRINLHRNVEPAESAGRTLRPAFVLFVHDRRLRWEGAGRSLKKLKRRRPIVTLTTDFGYADSYVAQMKGVLLGIHPKLTVVDVTHAIPAQDVLRAAAVLFDTVAAFPPHTIHIVVVDPGVGGDRPVLAVESPGGRLIAPDNGVLSLVVRKFSPKRVVRLTEPRFWRQPVSHTFHGRDIMAPVAAHWSLGRKMTAFGPLLDRPLAELSISVAHRKESALVGEVLWADSFGNLVTNIDAAQLPELREPLTVEVGGRRLAGICRYYSERPQGALMALIGSSGRLEIAVNQGSAAAMLSAGAGAIVRVVGEEGAGT
jgi:S-adenosyl-L-methionine hydrolase (adenosine-forming)